MSDVEGRGELPPAQRQVGRRPLGAGALLYGALWVVAAPALLVWWAQATTAVVRLPALRSVVAGAVLAAAGLALVVLGMRALRALGGGLPMNAYPPPRYVAAGVYRWLAHPIYVGFIVLAAGAAIATGSASGLWLVTPMAALALAALVWGYERHDLRRRFGAALRSPRLALPRDTEGDADAWERLTVYLLVLLPWLLAVERALSHTVGAFPAFHVLWPLFVAVAWQSRGRAWGAAGFALAALVAVSCVTTGMHSIVDVVFAFLLFPVFDGHRRVWESWRRRAERMASSWREWRVGPVRVIGHGIYAAAAGGLGSWLIGWLAGPRMVGPVVLLAVAALLGAALWGQALEGSSKLLRPLGFYGGMLGGLAGIVGLALVGVPLFPLLGAAAVALPWVQALGRLRCLVQGCCHGGPAPDWIGIRYRHPRSRVVQLADLAGVPLHPTPLYSILANAVIGLLLARLWSLGAAPGLVAGLYLVLSGLARFVEEAYRAEPQTPIVARLRIYQWLAVAGLLAGVALTTLGPSRAPAAGDPIDPWLLAAATVVGLLSGFVAGVDFPGSNRRFSRLAAS